MKAVTHNGDFHSDDIFGSALLRIVFEDIEIVRSRDESVIESADIVFDVGGVFDPSRRRFDHHQNGGAGSRQNGIPYASFGLLWKEYGENVCGNKDVMQAIDTKLVTPIDAVDNGVDICTPKIPCILPYSVQQFFSIFTPTWDEPELDRDIIFKKLSDTAMDILKREIAVSKSFDRAKSKVVDIYKNTEDKRIIVLDAQYPISLLQEFSDVIFVVYRGVNENDYRAKAMRKNSDCFDVKKPFPISWAGKEGKELQNITGVPTAKFAHQKQFLVGADTLDGALTLAKIALNA